MLTKHVKGCVLIETDPTTTYDELLSEIQPYAKSYGIVGMLQTKGLFYSAAAITKLDAPDSMHALYQNRKNFEELENRRVIKGFSPLIFTERGFKRPRNDNNCQDLFSFSELLMKERFYKDWKELKM